MNAWLVYLGRFLAFRFGFAPSADSCIGKRVLVGVTCLDEQGALIEQFQAHGRVARISNTEGIVLTKPDGGEFFIPPNRDCLQPARPGQYTQRADGRVIEDPDYIARFTLSGGGSEGLGAIKAHGFTGGFAPRG